MTTVARRFAWMKLGALLLVLALGSGASQAWDQCSGCWRCEAYTPTNPTSPGGGEKCEYIWHGYGDGCWCNNWKEAFTWYCETGGGACFATTVP